MSDWRETGRRADGVPIIHGSHDRPPLDSSVTILVASMLLNIVMALAIAVVLFVPTRHQPRFDRVALGMGALMLFLLLLSGTASLYAARTLVLRGRVNRSYPVEQLAVRLGIPPAALRDALQKSNVRPVCIVNDKEFYSLADLGDPDILLRPSAAPTTGGEDLVRPAESRSSPDPGILLTPAEKKARGSGDVV